MAEHSELMTEMPLIEKMSTQERLKHAKKRRLQQLKRYSQREKEYNTKKKKTDLNMNKRSNKRVEYKVHFVPFRRLLMLGVSPDSTNDDGLTALHQCCIDDSEDMLKLLIEFGANVNAQDSEQWTPLHAASTCGHLHLVKYLIDQGADLLAVNADGNMPYDICEDDSTLDYIESEMAKRGITQTLIDETRSATELLMLHDLKIIAENGGDLEFKDHQNATPLHVGAANGYLAVVEFLLDHHVSTEVCDKDMWKPIHAAACWGHPNVLEVLVQNGADLNARTKNGETPYDICEDLELKERILQLKSEVEIKRQTQTHKLKRSQSQNTRSHSVRRTSIREKSQISRREAREEAKLWQSKHTQEKEQVDLLEDLLKTQKEIEGSSQNFDKDFENKDNALPLSVDDIDVSVGIDKNISKNNDNNNKSATNTMNNQQVAGSLQLRQDKSDFSKPNYENLSVAKSTEKSSIIENSQEFSVVDYHKPNCMDDHIVIANEGSSLNTDGQRVQHNITPKDLKLDVSIHVTVNASPPSNNSNNSNYAPSPGTLADLKRQRSDFRSRNNSLSSQDIALFGSQRQSTSSTYSYNARPSPNSSLKKFTSDPSEVVGGSSKTGCCIIM
ncbi:Protein phosphatase 1 regulatory subunit 16A [Nymphon striatum]|nr:Protein phosphatase 1 regulatory subunit 16A [Nymphon striatum]